MYHNSPPFRPNSHENHRLQSAAIVAPLEDGLSQFAHSLHTFTFFPWRAEHLPFFAADAQHISSHERNYLTSEIVTAPLDSYFSGGSDINVGIDPDMEHNIASRPGVGGENVILERTEDCDAVAYGVVRPTLRKHSRFGVVEPFIQHISASKYQDPYELSEQPRSVLSTQTNFYDRSEDVDLPQSQQNDGTIAKPHPRRPWQLAYASKNLEDAPELDGGQQGHSLERTRFSESRVSQIQDVYNATAMPVVQDGISNNFFDQEPTMSEEQYEVIPASHGQSYRCATPVSHYAHGLRYYNGSVSESGSLPRTSSLDIQQGLRQSTLTCSPEFDERLCWCPDFHRSQSSKASLEAVPPERSFEGGVSKNNSGDEDDYSPIPSPANVALSKTFHKLKSDEFLVKARNAGWSYREIRVKGHFDEAESTLRGRYRNLTKERDNRVRKPSWTRKDIELLTEAVKHVAPDLLKVPEKKSHARSKITKAPWKEVAQYIEEHGGSYCFGYATCRKKWDEIMR